RARGRGPRRSPARAGCDERTPRAATGPMIDVAVVGLGRIGFTFQQDPKRFGAVTHVEAWRRHPMTRLVGAVDPEDAQRDAFEDATGVPAYPTWAELLRHEAPAVVSVCTPPAGQAASVLDALGAGAQRILCEKPCTASLDEA